VRILVVNPNTTASVTERVMAAGQAVAAPSTELIPLTASHGVPYIATRAEAVIGAAIVLEMLSEHLHAADAAIIAAFGDPGLFGARELFDRPVVGMAEAGLLTACMLGHRFAIVSFSAALGPWYEECVVTYGLSSRLAAIRLLDGAFGSVSDVQEEKQELLIELAHEAIRKDAADVIILAGAPLAGLADKVRDRIPVPLVDCAAAAVKQTEALIALNPCKALAGSFRRPPPKHSKGLLPALARRLAHQD
jgi:Asp/Glu/hydantoin racemase